MEPPYGNCQTQPNMTDSAMDFVYDGYEYSVEVPVLPFVIYMEFFSKFIRLFIIIN